MIYFARIDIGELSGQDLRTRTISIIKIGSTIQEVKHRILGHRSQLKKPVTLLATIPGGREEEKQIHHRFAHIRLPNWADGGTPPEWFWPTRELLEFIKNLSRRS